MDKKDFLQFEEDDTGKTSINGKHVFVTKRINGKVTHNKEAQPEKEIGKVLNSEEIVIGLNRNASAKSKEDDNKSLNNKTSNSKKKNKKKNILKSFLKILIILILLAGTAVFALISPIFNINEINVEGNDKVSTQTIISLSNIKKETNMFRYSKKEIIDKVKDNPYIESVNIERQLPSTINIFIEERRVAYQIKVMESYVYIDSKGYILERSSVDANVPVIFGVNTTQNEFLNNKRMADTDIANLNVILKIVDNAKSLEIYDLITNINIENGEYILYLKDKKKYIYLGDGNDVTNKMLYVKEILKSEEGKSGKIFIDGNLNNGFKPYFREE